MYMRVSDEILRDFWHGEGLCLLCPRWMWQSRFAMLQPPPPPRETAALLPPCCQVLSELTPKYQGHETETGEITWDELESRSESNSCIQTDLKLDI